MTTLTPIRPIFSYSTPQPQRQGAAFKAFHIEHYAEILALHPDDPHFKADLEILYKAIQNLEPENASLPETIQKQSAAWYWVLKDRYGVLQGLLMPPTQEAQEPQIHILAKGLEKENYFNCLQCVYTAQEDEHILYYTEYVPAGEVRGTPEPFPLVLDSPK